MRNLSDENTRLDEAFDVVPFQVKTVHSESESAMLIKNISKKLYAMNNEERLNLRTLYEKSLLNNASCYLHCVHLSRRMYSESRI